MVVSPSTCGATIVVRGSDASVRVRSGQVGVYNHPVVSGSLSASVAVPCSWPVAPLLIVKSVPASMDGCSLYVGGSGGSCTGGGS